MAAETIARSVDGRVANRILDSLTLGKGVAEHEADLEHIFVRTAVYRDLARDELDLVVGVKGSGKSAMFRFLARDGSNPNLARVDVISALDLAGDEIFRRVMKEWSGLPEDVLRHRWRVYVLALVGNQLLDDYPDAEEEHEELRVFLESLGIRQRKPSTRGLLRLFRSQPLIWPTEAPASEDVEDDLEEVANAIEALLTKVDRRAWAVFDRLDEVFYTDPDAEAVALRALIQLTKDLNARGNRLRVKLFLREDVLRRITRKRSQVNLTHLRRSDLAWKPDGLADIVCRRLARSSHFMREFDHTEADLRSNEGRRKVIGSLLPKSSPTPLPSCDHQRCKTTWDWLMLYLRDGKGYVAPRNLVTFFDLAVREQYAFWERDQPPDRVPHLLSGQALYRAWIELSTRRMDDTVVGEDGGLDSYLERLQNGAALYESRHELGERLHLKVGGPAFENVFERLVSGGVLRVVGGGAYEIALLYRPALKVRPQLR